MKACESTRRQLSAYLDGEVSLPERLFIDSHLNSCEACRQRKEELTRADRHLTSAPEPAWGSTDALIGRLRTELAKDRKAAAPPALQLPGFSLSSLKVPAFALAALCVILVVPSMFMMSSSSRMSSSAARSAERRPEPQALARVDAPRAGMPAAPVSTLQASGGGGAVAAAPPAELALADRDAARSKSLAKDDGMAPPPAVAGALAARPAGSATAPLSSELKALEARLAAVEREVSSFTTAARQEADRADRAMVASRRWAEWH